MFFFYNRKKPVPTHAQIAASELEDARQELLAEMRRLESAQCSVTILKTRVARLEQYTRENPVPKEEAPKRSFSTRVPPPIRQEQTQLAAA